MSEIKIKIYDLIMANKRFYKTQVAHQYFDSGKDKKDDLAKLAKKA